MIDIFSQTNFDNHEQVIFVTDSIADLFGIIAIQGVGATGADLTGRLVKHGAVVTIADVNESAVAQVLDRYSVSAVDPNIIHTQDVDVFAPRALGAVLNDTTKMLSSKGQPKTPYG